MDVFFDELREEAALFLEGSTMREQKCHSNEKAILINAAAAVAAVAATAVAVAAAAVAAALPAPIVHVGLHR